MTATVWLLAAAAIAYLAVAISVGTTIGRVIRARDQQVPS